MLVRSVLLSFAFAAALSPAQAKPIHPCAADAVAQARRLLKLHVKDDDCAAVDPDSVRTVGTIATLLGKGRFDVLEVTGSVYKTDYRMHMIYAQIPGDCVLMGEEILERSDPY